MRLDFICIASTLFYFSGMHAQRADCTLGLGGKDTEVIIQVFQLNAEQQKKMLAWATELQGYQKVMGDSIRLLFEAHPQKTLEELQLMATKYKALRDAVEQIAKGYDQRLLATFNQRQYERYKALCLEASRQPMPVAREAQEVKIPE